MDFTPALRNEYRRLFTSAKIRRERAPEVDSIVEALVAHRGRYESAGHPIGVPWWFVAVIHNMEASRNFNAHLHNGDPLTARTVHVPAARPVTGKPPFTWEASARDALTMRGLGHVSDWSISHALYQIEGYNGWGYRQFHSQVKSPYLWSFSQHYTSGKYVADGKWSSSAVSAQCGAAVLVRRMVDRGEIATVSAGAAAKKPAAKGKASKSSAPDVAWPGRVLKRATPPMTGEDVHAWQSRVHTRGYALEIDGVFGDVSDQVCRSFQQAKGLKADGQVGRQTWDATFAR
ncbi:MAG: hypothetical protein QOI98_2571 [Solirubrobacteraceae bacterium]|nr:hypothetical protein [Solirubrobacteraceae bacterium]